MRSGLFLALLAWVSFSGYANATPSLTESERSYLEIAEFNTEVLSVEDRLVPVEETPEFMMQDPFGTNPQPTNEGLAIAQIALKVWEIIQDGAPVVNAQYRNATALPTLANQRWEMLTGWRNERTIKMGMSTTNLYGMKTIEMEYQVKLIYGGSVGGKGKYIASARVVPTKVDVLWGYNLDLKAEIASILNIATAENPLASIKLDVTYRVSTILRSYSSADNFTLQGDGLMKSNNRLVFDAARF